MYIYAAHSQDTLDRILCTMLNNSYNVPSQSLCRIFDSLLVHIFLPATHSKNLEQSSLCSIMFHSHLYTLFNNQAGSDLRDDKNNVDGHDDEHL